MTPFLLLSLADLDGLRADTIIDVRAPLEFAQDHVPGAINLPVLSDAQRAQVGTIYTQDSPFNARKTGGALVAQNTAAHLQGPLADKNGAWQPLVYCWRGGQRSGAFATILDQVGWRVHLLKGGYQSYRRAVVRMLYDAPLAHRLVLIGGGTGTAKTALLAQLEAQGAQVLDLEGLAAHRGSLFGQTDTPQPAQKMFETRLAAALHRLDPDQITFVEAESSKVGERLVPPSLWAAMGAAPQVHVTAPLAARSAFLCSAYAELTQDATAFCALLDRLRPFHAAAQIDAWQTQARGGAWQDLAAGLIAEHYDPRYAKSIAGHPAPVLRLDLQALDAGTLARTAQDLRARFSRG